MNSFILADIKQHMGEWLEGCGREYRLADLGFLSLRFWLLVDCRIQVMDRRLEANSKSDSSRSVFLNAIGKSLPLLGVWTGIRVGVNFINLGPSGEFTESFILTGLEVLLVVGLGLLFYHLVEVPSSWLARQTEKTESKFDDMLVPVVRKSLRVTVVLFAIVSVAQ